ncbi:hypothetical protein EC957_000375 [Mortierella hygrophila]|uniref:Uncharacterized protein n=1 Tax=Mortierella hygrophila TaxID=979708 RepID=A0A9P6F7U8_9FUNG|nr:hypothetical protein EC957_000375 [Mortierella hygrophila]
MPIPRITIMPTTDTLQQHHYLTPELVAMENGVDPTRLSLSTISAESRDETDSSRRLHTPLLDLQEQGYAAATGSGEERAGGVVVEGEGSVLVMSGPGPMSAGDGDGLDRRYWQLAESVEDFTPDFADREEMQEAEQLDVDTTEFPRRRVRFMEEIQVIPSSRIGSDDDDDLTLIDDSEGDSSDESGDDDNSNNNSAKESLDLLPTIKSTLSEWKAIQVVESFLALEGEPIGTEKEHRDGGDTSAPVTVTALTPIPDPWTVALPPSPNPSAGTLEDDEGGCGYDHAVVPCPSTVLLQLAPVIASLPPTSTTSPIESPPPAAAATLKSAPPTITTITTTTHTKTTDENNNNNTCISPRTLELTSIRSQLHYWTETATHLRDQEQELTLHIDQLVQVMADVIEKCQETEVELLDQKRVVFELRLELDKEKEIGFASIQEAALSNREKQLLVLALEESRQEVENLRRTCAQQECEFKEGRRPLSSLPVQTQAQIRVQGIVQEQEQSQQGHQEDPQVNWIDAVDEGEVVEEQRVECQENLDQDQHEIERPLLPMDNNAAPTHKPITLATLSPAKVQQEDLYSFQSLIKSLFLILAATFILFSIMILISGYQHHLHQSFVHFLNTLSSISSGNTTILLEYLHRYSSIMTQSLKNVIERVGETVPDSVARAKVLSKDLSFLVEGVVGPLVWGDQQDLRLVRMWS